MVAPVPPSHRQVVSAELVIVEKWKAEPPPATMAEQTRLKLTSGSGVVHRLPQAKTAAVEQLPNNNISSLAKTRWR